MPAVIARAKGPLNTRPATVRRCGQFGRRGLVATVAGVPELLDPITLTGAPRAARAARASSMSTGWSAASTIDRDTYGLHRRPRRSGRDAALHRATRRGPCRRRRCSRSPNAGSTPASSPAARGSSTSGGGVAGTTPTRSRSAAPGSASTAQRTPINTEAKYLLLSHAFERWDVWRVAICTDERNERSRTAIVRIGATLRGRAAQPPPALQHRRTRAAQHGRVLDHRRRMADGEAVARAGWPRRQPHDGRAARAGAPVPRQLHPRLRRSGRARAQPGRPHRRHDRPLRRRVRRPRCRCEERDAYETERRSSTR